MSSSRDKECLRVLNDVFGHASFRPLQREIIEHILNGKSCLAVLPTGGGKSILYQLPAVLLKKMVVVVSPLLALIRNQWSFLRSRGIHASTIHSQQKAAERRQVEQDLSSPKPNTQILYVTAEWITSEKGLDMIRSLQEKRRIVLIAIDEAHCISSWGHDFRPKYRQLRIIRTTCPSLPMVALTATAHVRTRRDILEQLLIPDEPENVFVASFNRKEIFYRVFMKDLPHSPLALDCIERLVEKYPGGSGIVYCRTREETERMAMGLKSHDISIECYHAGLSSKERHRVQNEWESGSVQIVCATVAFGMGIDRSNVRFVVHLTLPKSIEAYYQESGRAGRDRLPAESILFYSREDVRRCLFLCGDDERQKKLLQSMSEYCECEGCRRRPLLHYFGDFDSKPFAGVGGKCDGCDWCENAEECKRNLDQMKHGMMVRGDGGYGMNIVDSDEEEEEREREERLSGRMQGRRDTSFLRNPKRRQSSLSEHGRWLVRKEKAKAREGVEGCRGDDEEEMGYDYEDDGFGGRILKSRKQGSALPGSLCGRGEQGGGFSRVSTGERWKAGGEEKPKSKLDLIKQSVRSQIGPELAAAMSSFVKARSLLKRPQSGSLPKKKE